MEGSVFRRRSLDLEVFFSMVACVGVAGEWVGVGEGRGQDMKKMKDEREREREIETEKVGGGQGVKERERCGKGIGSTKGEEKEGRIRFNKGGEFRRRGLRRKEE
ncbi:hypothetical protein Pcinc_028777 [Petrolisthes cinctipes]|uniref:Uncharacterized protein n=1 Tax=Petrolisthes cinctipes TaxID=88211 RepID=A0AAE1F2E0_PETCI|nr:hypothetical protein Pcinc_028777 [Petrolisthes cinctipes]